MKNYYFILTNWLSEANENQVECYEIEPSIDVSKVGQVSSVTEHSIDNIVNSTELTLQDDIRNIVVLPSELMNLYHLSLPAKKKSDLLSMIPFSLEDEVAEKISDIHWMVIEWKPKQFVDVVTINKSHFENTLAWFANKGIILDDIIPDYMLLPIHPQTSHSLAKINDDRFLIYSHRNNRGFALDNSLFDIWWQDQENKKVSFAVNNKPLAKKLISDGGENVSYWDFGSNIEQWLSYSSVNTTTTKQPYLLRDKYAKPKSKSHNNRQQFKKALVLFSLGLLSYILLSLLNYGYQSYKLNNVNHKVERSFNQLFGNGQYQTNHNDWLQIRQQVNRIKGQVDQQSTYFTLMTMLSPVLGQYGQTLNQIQFDGVVLNASTQVSTFDELNDVVNEFRSLYPSASIRISESERIDNKVTGNYQIVLKGN